MVVTPAELEEAKRQLNAQVEAMPDGAQKDAARQQLAGMSDEAISALVEQQRAQMQEGGEQKGRQKGIFRMIVDGDVPSKKIDENKEAIAVVSIRPVSKGHVIVIPKVAAEETKNLPSMALTLAKKVASKMSSKLGARRVEIQTSGAFNEKIVNVIPVYDKTVDVNSVAYEASEEELNEVYDLLRVVKKPKKKRIVVRSKKKKEEPVLKLKRRVP